MGGLDGWIPGSFLPEPYATDPSPCQTQNTRSTAVFNRLAESYNFPPQISMDAERGPHRDPVAPERQTREGFRHNAKAWALYLQEAEGNARDQVEVWKTGLESLLIFVRRSC